jgi:hypothetical protein
MLGFWAVLELPYVVTRSEHYKLSPGWSSGLRSAKLFYIFCGTDDGQHGMNLIFPPF